MLFPSWINDLDSRKGSRSGNCGNHLEFEVLTLKQTVPWLNLNIENKIELKIFWKFSGKIILLSTLVLLSNFNMGKITNAYKTPSFDSIEQSTSKAHVYVPTYKKETPSSTAFSMKPTTPTNNKVDSKYGAWGPIFKNRENFNSMHIC